MTIHSENPSEMGEIFPKKLTDSKDMEERAVPAFDFVYIETAAIASTFSLNCVRAVRAASLTGWFPGCNLFFDFKIGQSAFQ